MLSPRLLSSSLQLKHCFPPNEDDHALPSLPLNSSLITPWLLPLIPCTIHPALVREWFAFNPCIHMLFRDRFSISSGCFIRPYLGCGPTVTSYLRQSLGDIEGLMSALFQHLLYAFCLWPYLMCIGCANQKIKCSEHDPALPHLIPNMASKTGHKILNAVGPTPKNSYIRPPGILDAAVLQNWRKTHHAFLVSFWLCNLSFKSTFYNAPSFLVAVLLPLWLDARMDQCGKPAWFFFPRATVICSISTKGPVFPTADKLYPVPPRKLHRWLP